MTIKDSKMRVTFVTEKETNEIIKRLVEEEKQRGRKMTVSKYIDQVLRDHVMAKALFK